MEITDLRVTKLGVHLDDPSGMSRDRETEFRPAAIIEIETDTGLVGIGEGYGPNPHVIETLVTRKYAEKLRGENPLDIERLWDEMVRKYTYWDQKGAAISAASGIDMALWDLKGKYYETPVHRLLGGDAWGDGTVRAYASDLFWDDPDSMAETAAGYVDRGFQAVKGHFGRGLAADRERVQAINAAIGDTHLMVDLNCGYEYPEALRVGQMLAANDVYWYEEPIAPYEVERLAELREKLAVPIATGENEYTKWGFKTLFDAGAVDFAMPDIMRCGGITETKKICTLAEAYGVTPTPHNYSTGVGLAATLQVVAATPTSDWLEYDTTDFALYEDFLVSDLAIDDRGHITVPTEPGLGVEIPDELVSAYEID